METKNISSKSNLHESDYSYVSYSVEDETPAEESIIKSKSYSDEIQQSENSEKKNE